MREGQKHTRTYLKENRSLLRKSLTPAEAHLWRLLKGKNLLGRKFQRQHSIENFIVDFYCASEKVIIELDGEVHNNIIAQQNDFERDEHLTNLGFIVLRFENKEVFQNTQRVLEVVKQSFNIMK